MDVNSLYGCLRALMYCYKFGILMERRFICLLNGRMGNLMKEKFFNTIRSFWVMYFTLLFLCSLGAFIPTDKDIIWLWLWTFFIPFSFVLVYPYGFFTGIWIQCKLHLKIKQLCLLSIAYFVLTFCLLVIFYLDGMFKNGILHNIDAVLYPTFGSTLLFVLGAGIAKLVQRKRFNRHWVQILYHGKS